MKYELVMGPNMVVYANKQKAYLRLNNKFVIPENVLDISIETRLLPVWT